MNPILETAWNNTRSALLFPLADTHPYYIVAPRWTYGSAGVRALHLLCHALNRSGWRAFLIQYPFQGSSHPWTNSELFTPVLDKQQARRDLEQGLTPIVLYPEVVPGNPLKAPVVARWVLNFPGLLGGDSTYDKDELCFGYCRELAAAAGNPGQVLHMPTVDTRIFYPSDDQPERHGGCFCASKYKVVHNGVLDPITDGCFEITRQLPDSLTPKEVASLLRRSEVFYAYENTALVTEAVLCGCPAVFIPNPYLTKMIGQEELGTDGIAWGTDPAALDLARATVEQGAINYLKTYDQFWDQLDTFVTATQARAKEVPYTELISFQWPLTGIRKQIHRVKKEVLRFTRKVQKMTNCENM